jgi:DNA-binding Lrp family transcriptional regulator
MDNPDRIDWEIIALLNGDGRIPSVEIERRLENVSTRNVTNRIDAPIKKGIINIRTVVNPFKVGYGIQADIFIEVLGKLPGARHTHTYPPSLMIKKINTWLLPNVLED